MASLTNCGGQQFQCQQISLRGKAAQVRASLHTIFTIANGSLHETETLLLIAVDLGFIKHPICNDLLGRTAEVGRLLGGLLCHLRAAN